MGSTVLAQNSEMTVGVLFSNNNKIPENKK
jgi:hypothetical protein